MPWPAERCPSCPRTRPGPCFAQVHRTGHLCDPASPAHARYLPLLRGDVELQPPPPPDPDAPVPAWLAAARAKRALWKAAKACPDRTPDGGCGCDGWCARGRGTRTPFLHGPDRYRVTLDDCGACLGLGPVPNPNPCGEPGA